jgi:hypothetical protein
MKSTAEFFVGIDGQGDSLSRTMPSLYTKPHNQKLELSLYLCETSWQKVC